MIKNFIKTKKSLTKWTLLLCLAFVSMHSIKAQIKYDLEINGVKVTSDNCKDLSVIDGVSGKVSYDDNTKTLTLDGAVIQEKVYGKHGIINSIDGLTIKLINKNNIHTNGFSSILASKNTEISGTGSLFTNAFINVGENTSLTIKECNIGINSAYFGIAGYLSPQNSILIIDNATIRIEADREPMGNFKNITLKNCEATSHYGAYFDPKQKLIVDANGNIIKNNIIIEPIIKYDLEINGIKVTSDNCKDLSVIDGVSGKVSYDDNTKTLTLDGAVIQEKVYGKHGIINSIDGLTIKLINKNNIYTNGFHSILASKNTEISGTGSLFTNAFINVGENTSLTIKECNIGINSAYFGIAGYLSPQNSILIIDNATIRIEAGREPMGNFKNITLKNCEATSHYGAYFDSKQKLIVDANGNIIKNNIIIEPIVKEDYDLHILGVKVNYKNRKNLSVIDGVSGKVSYNHKTKTLTLNGAIIKDKTKLKNGIVSNIDGLTIKLVNENEVYAGYASIKCLKNTKIIGTGSLFTNAYLSATKDVLLAIKDCNIEIDCENYGIAGYLSPMSSRLIIDNATIKVKKSGMGSIVYFNSITLNNCKIISPKGAKFDSKQKSIVDAKGNVIKDEIIIKPTIKYDLEINGVKVTFDNCKDLSVIDGVSGKISYDDNIKTLTLDGAIINNKGENKKGIYSSIDGLIIKLINKNEIYTKGYSSIVALKNTEISGTGSLFTNSFISTEKNNISLTIKDCNIDINSKHYGIVGYFLHPQNSSLIIDNANIKAKGTKIKAIAFFKDITLNNCKVTSHEGAYFDFMKKCIVDANGNIIEDKIVVKSTITSIGNTYSDSSIILYPNPAQNEINIKASNEEIEQISIYNQKGMELLWSNKSKVNIESLPKGMYIIRIKTTNGKLLHSKLIKN